jgi:hypothetical protein
MKCSKKDSSVEVGRANHLYSTNLTILLPRWIFSRKESVEVGFGHASFVGIDLLKFQVASYSGLDKIDVGVYVVTTHAFQTRMKKDYGQNWEGSLSFGKVVRYLPHFKSAIQLPIYVLGIDL